MINQQNITIKNGSNWDKICPFPIGFIYMSTNSTSPASTYGGSWSALTDSKFLRPSNSWNSSGGSTKININQIPKHTHEIDSSIIKYFEDRAGTIRRGESYTELSGVGEGFTTYSAGGRRLLATLPHLLRLVQNGLISISWMEV